mmetsp:Transcript_12299/g.20796  ORF Transcript_12299/g.20796 Transcript_12299/m.20796 type:complete len:224 (+) Transcript_12299:1327-1998(+)
MERPLLVLEGDGGHAGVHRAGGFVHDGNGEQDRDGGLGDQAGHGGGGDEGGGGLESAHDGHGGLHRHGADLPVGPRLEHGAPIGHLVGAGLDEGSVHGLPEDTLEPGGVHEGGPGDGDGGASSGGAGVDGHGGGRGGDQRGGARDPSVGIGDPLDRGSVHRARARVLHKLTGALVEAVVPHQGGGGSACQEVHCLLEHQARDLLAGEGRGVDAQLVDHAHPHP